MKRVLGLVLALLLLMTTGVLACAEDVHDMEPETGAGWLHCTIQGQQVEFTYTGSTKSMSTLTHSFASDLYTMNIVFNKKLEVGTAMTVNAIQSLELISSDNATAGYYQVKKSTSQDVDSEVLLEQPAKEGCIQGTFRIMIHPIERYVGDVRPGMIQDLELTDGSFCFHP